MLALKPRTRFRIGSSKTVRAEGERLCEHQSWKVAEAALAQCDRYPACSHADGQGFLGSAHSLLKSSRRPSAVDDDQFGFELLAEPEFIHASRPAQIADALRSLDEVIKEVDPIAALAGITHLCAAEELDWKPAEIAKRDKN